MYSIALDLMSEYLTIDRTTRRPVESASDSSTSSTFMQRLRGGL